MTVASILTVGLGVFGRRSKIITLGYSSSTTLVVVDGHDGGDDDKKFRQRQARLHDAVEQSYENVYPDLKKIAAREQQARAAREVLEVAKAKRIADELTEFEEDEAIVALLL